MMPVLLLAALIACLPGPGAAFQDLQEQLIPAVVPDTDWRSSMQLPIDLQELAAASLEAGSYGYGAMKESAYGYSISKESGAAYAAAGWRRMLLQQADAALAPLLQPGSYSYSSSTDIDGSYGGSTALAEAAAAGSYGRVTIEAGEGFAYGSMRTLLQEVYSAAGSYGSADAVPAGSYGSTAATEAGLYGLYGGMRRLLQDSTSAAGSYGDAAAATYGADVSLAGSYGNAAAAAEAGLYGSMTRQESATAAGSYGDVASTDEGHYGSTRSLLQDNTIAAGSAADTAAPTDSSDGHVVLVVDVPAAFNAEDNTLVLSFSGAWTHTASSSFSAAFRLELLDASGTEVLTFDSPTLHHRTLNKPQPQQHKSILLNYTTLFSDVQLVPGQRATLRLTTQDSSFQGFQASIRLFWQQQQQQDEGRSVIESATPGAYGESTSPGKYAADTMLLAAAAAAAAADALDTISPESPDISSREQLPNDPPAPVAITSSSSSSNSSSSSDDTLALAPIMDPTDPAAPLDIREAPVGLVDPPTLAAAAGTVLVGQDSSVTNTLVTQPVVAPDEVVPSAPATPEIVSVTPSVIADVPADAAAAVPTAVDADTETHTTAAAVVDAVPAVEGVTPAAVQDMPSAAAAAVVDAVPAVEGVTPAAAQDMPSAAAAAVVDAVPAVEGVTPAAVQDMPSAAAAAVVDAVPAVEGVTPAAVQDMPSAAAAAVVDAVPAVEGVTPAAVQDMPSAAAAAVVDAVPAVEGVTPAAVQDTPSAAAAAVVDAVPAVEGVTPAAVQDAPVAAAAFSESPLDVPAVVAELPSAAADAAVPAPADAAPAADAPAAHAAAHASVHASAKPKQAAATAARPSAKHHDHQKPAKAGSPASANAKFIKTSVAAPAAAPAAHLQVHLTMPGHTRGPNMPDEAATAVTGAAGPVTDAQPQQTADAQTLPAVPATPPVGLTEGQAVQPMVAAAVPLPSNAFAGSLSDSTTDSTGVTTAADFGCRKKIARGLQCGGTGGHCGEAAQTGTTPMFGTAGAAAACKDEPYVGVCCASGTVCARKSEVLWVCAPGHGFLRRMLA